MLPFMVNNIGSLTGVAEDRRAAARQRIALLGGAWSAVPPNVRTSEQVSDDEP